MQQYQYDDQDPSKAIKLFRNFGPEYFHYLNYKESSGHRDTAVSKSGAMGAMQMKPIALKQLQKIYPQLSYIKEQDLVDKPELNMKLASAYLDYIGDGINGYYKRRGITPPAKIDPGLILFGYRLGPTALTDVLDKLPKDQWNYHGVRNAFVNDMVPRMDKKAYSSKEKDSIVNYWDSILFHGKMFGGQKEKWRPELQNIVKNPKLFHDGAFVGSGINPGEPPTSDPGSYEKQDIWKQWLEHVKKVNDAAAATTPKIIEGTDPQTPSAGDYMEDDAMAPEPEEPESGLSVHPNDKRRERLKNAIGAAGVLGDVAGGIGIQQGNVGLGGIGSAVGGFAKAGIPGAVIQGGLGAISALQNKSNMELADLEKEQSQYAAKSQGRDMGYGEYGRMYAKGGQTRRMTFRPNNIPLSTEGTFRITAANPINFGFKTENPELDMEDEEYGGMALKYYDDPNSVLPAGLAKYRRGLGRESWDHRASLSYEDIDPDPSKQIVSDTIRPNAVNTYLFNQYKKDGNIPDYIIHTKVSGTQTELSPIQKALKVADDILSAPARGMVKAITGKYQDPSEAWGYKDPKGFWQNAANVGIDMVADPMNLLGAGIAKSIGFKTVPKLTKLGKASDIGNTMGDVVIKADLDLARKYMSDPKNLKDLYKGKLDTKFNDFVNVAYKEFPEIKTVVERNLKLNKPEAAMALINDAIKIKEGKASSESYDPHYNNGYTIGPVVNAKYKPSTRNAATNNIKFKKRIVQSKKQTSKVSEIPERRITQAVVVKPTPKRDTTYWQVSPIVGKTKDSYQLTKQQFEDLLYKRK